MEAVLYTLPGLHVPVTRSTAGADGSCRLTTQSVLLVGRRTTCLMSRAPNTAGNSSSDMASSELTRVPASSELHTNVIAKSSHFFTSSGPSSDDDDRSSKLKYNDESDVCCSPLLHPQLLHIYVVFILHLFTSKHITLEYSFNIHALSELTQQLTVMRGRMLYPRESMRIP